MTPKSVTFPFEITITTLYEEHQTKEVLAALAEGMKEGANAIASQMAAATDGLFMAKGKIINTPEDWQ